MATVSHFAGYSARAPCSGQWRTPGTIRSSQLAADQIRAPLIGQRVSAGSPPFAMSACWASLAVRAGCELLRAWSDDANAKCGNGKTVLVLETERKNGLGSGMENLNDSIR